MKTLIFGAGPIGSVYAYLLHKAGKDVTILARNKQYEFIKTNGLVMQRQRRRNSKCMPTTSKPLPLKRRKKPPTSIR